MPELPEIANLALQMSRELPGRTITRITVRQPKCLNLPVRAFTRALTGARIEAVTAHGKWLFVQTTQGWLLLCLGMGGEVLLVTPQTLPRKHRLAFALHDGACLAIHFWWFGYAHYAPPDALARHAMTRRLGPNALGIPAEAFAGLLRGRRGRLKSLLLDQSKIAGIGNYYIHDILFDARLHPLRRMETLRPEEIASLHRAIQRRLARSLAKGGAHYELDLYGQPGRYGRRDSRVAYRDDEPCPRCQTPIEKIRTGGTSSMICPACQPRAARARRSIKYRG